MKRNQQLGLAKQQRRRLGLRGNIPLEMVIITPLALLLLFVGLDAGFAYIQRAAVVDALRSGMNGAGLMTKTSSILEFDPVAGPHINSNKANEVVADVLSDIRTSLAKVIGEASSNYKVRVQALVLEVDANSGIVTDRSREVFAEQYPLGNGSHDLPEADPERYNYQSLDSFLDLTIQPGSEMSRRFAIPEAPSYSTASSSNRTLRYLPLSVVLVGEIQAITNGINTPFTKSILGKYFAVAEKQIVPLRVQLM